MELDCDVTVLDDFSTGEWANLVRWRDASTLHVVKGSVCDSKVVEEAVRDTSIVFHLAAIVSVPASVERPREVLDTNVMGTATVLDACRIHDVERVVVASSSAVYGDPARLPIDESIPVAPISPYAVSKLAQEHLVASFERTYGLSGVALRYFNVYGPRQQPGGYAGVISIFTEQALSGRSLTIEGDGEQTRDFVYVEDVVTATLLASVSQTEPGEVFNVGTGRALSINGLAQHIISLTGGQSSTVHVDPRVGDIRHSVASIDRASERLGFTPSVDIVTGLRRTIDWMRQQHAARE